MPHPPMYLNESREGELLLLLARVSPDRAACARAEELIPAVDWGLFQSLARRQCVWPLVYRSLAENHARAVPAGVLSELRQAFYRNAKANLARIVELKRLTSLLEQAKIPVMALKGPALAAMAYGDPGLRCYGDLDIIVPEDTLNRAVQRVREEGYEPLWQLTPHQQRIMLRHGYHYNLRATDGDLQLEIHWRLIDGCFAFMLPSRQFWDNRVSVQLGSDTVETLAPEDQLLFLCLHGAKHFWSSLRMVCDVAELIKRCPDLDWPALSKTVSQSQSGRILTMGLRLAESLLGVRLPAEAGALMQSDSGQARLLRDALEFISLEVPEGIPVARMTSFHLRLLPTLSSKWHYLRAISAPKELDVLTFRLPPALAPFYLVLRPFRLLLRLR